MWVRATRPAVFSDVTKKGSLVAKMIGVFPVSDPRVYPQVLSATSLLDFMSKLGECSCANTCTPSLLR